MKKSFLFLFVLFSNVMISQNVFEYHKQFDLLLKQTQDPNSEISYEKQLKKYVENDKQQTDMEMLCLLIGYTAKKEYKPYFDLSIANELYQLNEDGKYQQVVDKANKMLEINPFHIKVMIEMSYALNGLGKTEESDNMRYRMYKIYKCMAFSCNGDPKKYPIFALSPKDGQYFIKYYIRWQLGTMGSGVDENGNFIDVLEAKNDKDSVIYHFIIEHAKRKMMEE